MDIQGPLKIHVFPDESGSAWQLLLSFTPEFQAMDIAAQGASFADYVAELASEVGRREEQDANRQGMLIVLQIAEQLLPHIQSGDLAVEESIIIQVAREQAVSITDLLKFNA